MSDKAAERTGFPNGGDHVPDAETKADPGLDADAGDGVAVDLLCIDVTGVIDLTSSTGGGQ